jgi:hypothetical protein
MGMKTPTATFYPTDCNLSSDIPDTSPYIGMGDQNTSNIYNALSQFENDFGVKACSEFASNVNDQYYDDWLLPSIEELQLIYENLFLLWLGDLDLPDTSLQSGWENDHDRTLAGSGLCGEI